MGADRGEDELEGGRLGGIEGYEGERGEGTGTGLEMGGLGARVGRAAAADSPARPDLPAAAEALSSPQPSSSSSSGGGVGGGSRRPQRLPAPGTSAEIPASPRALPAGQPQRPCSRLRERGMARPAAPRERLRSPPRRKEVRRALALLSARKKSRYAGALSFCGWNEPSVRPAGERRAALSEMTRSNPASRGSRRGAGWGVNYPRINHSGAASPPLQMLGVEAQQRKKYWGVGVPFQRHLHLQINHKLHLKGCLFLFVLQLTSFF